MITLLEYFKKNTHEIMVFIWTVFLTVFLLSILAIFLGIAVGLWKDALA